MKLTNIRYGVKLNLGNYSSEEIVLEYSADVDETLDAKEVIELAKTKIREHSAYSNKKNKGEN